MGEQEKQVYQLMGEVRQNVAEMKDLAHKVNELNRKIGTPPPSEKVNLEKPPKIQDPEPICITDYLVDLSNNSNEAANQLRSAVEDLGNLV